MMKRFIKKLSVLLLGAVCLFSGCQPKVRSHKPWLHEEFSTEYTVEEHIQRLTSRTEEIFSSQISNGEIVSYTVDIVYAFYDNDPEYFLVELEYAEEWEGDYRDPNIPITGNHGRLPNEYIQYKTKFSHIIGFISNDKYWLGLEGYPYKNIQGKMKFLDGRSAYRLYGYTKGKFYYGAGVQAVEIDSGIEILYDARNCLSEYGDGVSPEFHKHCEEQTAHIQAEYDFRHLMIDNVKYAWDAYQKEK